MARHVSRYKSRISNHQLNIGNVVIKFLASFILITIMGFYAHGNAYGNGHENAAIKKIVFFGDSLTAGYNLPANKGIVGQLQQALNKEGFEVELINAGVSGDTTAAGLQRLDWSVGDDVDAVFLELGANDMLRGLPAKIAKENLSKIIERLKTRNIKVFLAGMMAAPNLGETYVKEFNAMFPELAKTYDLPFYPFFMEGIAAQSEFLQEDGLHPNEKGVNELKKRLLPFIKAQLQQ